MNRTLEYDSYTMGYFPDRPVALLAVESDAVNSIRWYRTRKENLPLVRLRKYSNAHDDNTICEKQPIYLLNGDRVTDVLAHDIITCARAIFNDIEEMIKKTNKPRFGAFLDYEKCKLSPPFFVIDGGLFMIWQEANGCDIRTAVECQVMIVGESNGQPKQTAGE